MSRHSRHSPLSYFKKHRHASRVTPQE
jgi:hypothetical protein